MVVSAVGHCQGSFSDADEWNYGHRGPPTDVLYMSGYTDDKVRDISSSGELTLIQKPFYIDEPVRRVREILARKVAQENRISALSP